MPTLLARRSAATLQCGAGGYCWLQNPRARWSIRREGAVLLQISPYVCPGRHGINAGQPAWPHGSKNFADWCIECTGHTLDIGCSPAGICPPSISALEPISPSCCYGPRIGPGSADGTACASPMGSGERSLFLREQLGAPNACFPNSAMPAATNLEFGLRGGCTARMAPA